MQAGLITKTNDADFQLRLLLSQVQWRNWGYRGSGQRQLSAPLRKLSRVSDHLMLTLRFSVTSLTVDLFSKLYHDKIFW